MKILLFGKNGQLGWELQRSLAPLGEVVALGSSGEVWPSDFRYPETLGQVVRAVQPHVVVNAAAYTAVDKAELDADVAFTVNAAAPGVLAQAAQAAGAWLVHYSSDYVFDGSGDRPWTEADTPAPLSVYGASKLEGERLVAQHCERHLIFRTSWVYAARGGNFVKTMLHLARERDELRVVDDQHGAPTGADLLADVTAHAVRAVLAAPKSCNPSGLYHAVAGGHTTWHAYACHVLATARAAGVSLRATPSAVVPVPSGAFATVARRPHNSRLDKAKIERTFGLNLPPWQAGVERLLAETLPLTS